MKTRPPVYLTRKMIEGVTSPGKHPLEVQQPPAKHGIELFYNPDAPLFHKTSAWAATLLPEEGKIFLDVLLGKLAEGSHPTMNPRTQKDVVYMFGIGATYGMPSVIADTHALAIDTVPGYTLTPSLAGVYLDASLRQRAAFHIREVARFEDDFHNPKANNPTMHDIMQGMEEAHRFSRMSFYDYLIATAQAEMVNAATRQAALLYHEPNSIIEFLDTSKWMPPGMVFPLPNPNPRNP